MTTYKIIFANNSGSFAVEELAAACGGMWRDAVERYDGDRDIAFIDLPAENRGYMEELMEADDNVIGYQEV